MKKRALAVRAAVLGVLGVLGPAGPARAELWQLGGELRLNGALTAASPGQLGDPSQSNKGCLQPQTIGDGGAGATATAVALLSSSSYRYQLGLSGGYYWLACTPALRRPVGGLDYRGEHRFGERTRMDSSLRILLDSLDPGLDALSGNVSAIPAGMGGMKGPTTTAPSVGGKLFMTFAGGVELEHQFAGRYGFHVGLGWQGLEILSSVSDLPIYTTLGPMESVELLAYPFRDTVRERIELPVRYRVSEFYAGTAAAPLLSDPVTLPNGTYIPPMFVREAPRPSRSQVPVAHDVALRAAWESRWSRLWTARLGGGLAVAYQPNLCLPGRDDATSGRCGIDPVARGIRGRFGPPTLEVALGDQAAGTFELEAGLTYRDRLRSIELVLDRAYEPNPYSASLALVNRGRGTVLYRATPDLRLNAGVLGSVLTFTSPGRVNCATVSDPSCASGNSDAGQVSPQNRLMYSIGGQAGLDWVLSGPVALFVSMEWSVYALQGDHVLDAAKPPYSRYVQSFPASPSTMVNPDLPPNGLLITERITVVAGLRLFWQPSTRERELLPTARAVP